MSNDEVKLSEIGSVKSNNDFFRCDIMKVIELFGNNAILFTSKYVHTLNTKWATFKNIRVFDETLGKKTKFQLTDHINIDRHIINEYVTLTPEEHNLKFFILGIPYKYQHYGHERGGIKLCTQIGITPILRAPEKEWIWQNEIDKLLEAKNQFNKRQVL